MAEFLTTAGTAHKLETLISGANARLTLISPYLQVLKILLERLHDAARRRVAITVVCREEDLGRTERSQLEEIARLELRFMANLHAKCFLSESGVVITSMNLYQHSVQNNREMGVYFGASEEPFAAAAAEAASIVAAATRPKGTRAYDEHRVQSTMGRGGKTGPRSGSCLRCGSRVPFDPSRPLCTECYRTWAAFGNAEYPEHFCHECGDTCETSMARPLCETCYAASF